MQKLNHLDLYGMFNTHDIVLHVVNIYVTSWADESSLEKSSSNEIKCSSCKQDNPHTPIMSAGFNDLMYGPHHSATESNWTHLLPSYASSNSPTYLYMLET